MANKRITDVDIITSLDGDESFFINKNNAIKQINREDIVFGISNGGTGATTVAAARNNLGLGNTSGALPVANGGTGTTTLQSLRNNLGLGNTSGALPVANGGTGATTVAAARNNLGLGNTSGALPIANGGTGATDAATARANLGLGNTSGALPIANGGTGATTVAAARNNLGAQSQHITSTATLFASGWSNLTQTVSVSGVNASNTVIARPAPASYIAYCEAGVYCYAQSSGSLTFKCVDTPTSDLTVNILILN